MARMSKRISNKITKTKEQQNAPKEQKKYGKDIWLILLIVINVREWLYKAQIFFMGIILLLFLYTVVAYIFG